MHNLTEAAGSCTLLQGGGPARPHQGERALGGLAADGLRVEGRWVAPQPHAQTGHQVGALAGERRGIGPGLRGGVLNPPTRIWST